jgi:hypothetical protein
MSDPFEDFLEEALGGPDLELGHEMRRRLLEAAVAGERVRPDNVVPLNRADPDETAGFAWLVGEAAASTELMSRMIGDPTFLETLDGERSFLHTLRASLRRSSAAAVAAPARRQRIAAVALSAAAALTLAAGAILMNGLGQKPTTAVAVAPVGQAVPATPSAAAEVATAGSEQIAVDSPSGGGGAGLAASGAGLPEDSSLAKMELPDMPEHGGTGRSVDPGDPLMEIPQLQDALAFEAKESVLPEPMLAMLGGGLEGGSFGGGTDGALASLGGEFSSGQIGGVASLGGMQSGSTGMASLTGPGRNGGGRESSIPEPGGAMPVMLGLLVLLLKRPRRSKGGVNG